MNKTENVEEREFTAEETAAQLRANEKGIIDGMKEADNPDGEAAAPFGGDILKGMLAAAKYQNTETKNIEVVRGGQVYFQFRIRPLTEKEYEKCRKKATKFVRNKQIGIKVPEEVNNSLHRSMRIHAATVAEDRKRTWDNKQLWAALEETGREILTASDVIDAVLLPGEKAAIVEQIDLISGFKNNDLEEVIKN